MLQVFGCTYLIRSDYGINIYCIGITTGSDVDPDDNGLLKSKEAKEKWRQEKLKKFENTDDP